MTCYGMMIWYVSWVNVTFTKMIVTFIQVWVFATFYNTVNVSLHSTTRLSCLHPCGRVSVSLLNYHESVGVFLHSSLISFHTPCPFLPASLNRFSSLKLSNPTLFTLNDSNLMFDSFFRSVCPPSRCHCTHCFFHSDVPPSSSHSGALLFWFITIVLHSCLLLHCPACSLLCISWVISSLSLCPSVVTIMENVFLTQKILNIQNYFWY